jgi:hypothetical protein
MQIITNEKLIRRNAKIGQVTSLVALFILGGGLYISFRRPQQFGLSLIALIIGFTLSQIGLYFGNRWGRSPRPDQMLDQGLKGLPGEYSIYHYRTPASHLLVGPAGLWTLIPYHQRGTLTYEKGRWRMKGGGFMQGYLRLFGQENIGRPEMEAGAEVDALKRYLAKQISEEEMPPIQAALVFTNDSVEIQCEDAPIPTLQLKRLKDFIRKCAREHPLAVRNIEKVKAVFPKE